jgi:hypothetical protein
MGRLRERLGGRPGIYGPARGPESEIRTGTCGPLPPGSSRRRSPNCRPGSPGSSLCSIVPCSLLRAIDYRITGLRGLWGMSTDLVSNDLTRLAAATKGNAKIRNSKSEILDKFKIGYSNVQNKQPDARRSANTRGYLTRRSAAPVLSIRYLIFGFVSDFLLRISDFKNAHPVRACSGRRP